MTAIIKDGVPYETERKYLIAYPDRAALMTLPGAIALEIVQVYLRGGAARIRSSSGPMGTVYIYTEKHRVTELTRIENEREISHQEYLSLLSSADPAFRPIEKTRLCIPHMGHVFEIDIYPFWQDKAIAEVELASEDEEIILPEWLDIIQEVTLDPAYKNTSLARIK